MSGPTDELDRAVRNFLAQVPPGRRAQSTKAMSIGRRSRSSALKSLTGEPLKGSDQDRLLATKSTRGAVE